MHSVAAAVVPRSPQVALLIGDLAPQTRHLRQRPPVQTRGNGYCALTMSEHYFSPSPGTPSRPRSITLTLPDIAVELTTDQGMFSPDHVDAGTRVLLDVAPMPTTDDHAAMDGGAGYGPISIVLARRCPDLEITAVEVNERARDLCAENARRLDCSNVTVCAPEALPGRAPFDVIYSNPPVRIGKAAMRELLMSWLGLLSPDGRAYLVVHKNLGADSLSRWLGEQGFLVERIGTRQGFRVLEVRPGFGRANTAVAAQTEIGST